MSEKNFEMVDIPVGWLISENATVHSCFLNFLSLPVMTIPCPLSHLFFSLSPSLDHRHFTITRGAIPQSNGSSRVVSQSRSEVIVGVKAELHRAQSLGVGGVASSLLPGAPPSAAAAEGSAGGGHGGSGAASKVLVSVAGRAGDDSESADLRKMEVLLSEVLNSSADMAQALRISEDGSARWVLFLDALVVTPGGNAMETLFMAAAAALQDTHLPVVTLSPAHALELDTPTPGAPSFDLAIDDYGLVPLPLASPLPVCVSCHFLRDHLFLDPEPVEQLLSEATVHLVIDSHSGVVGMSKTGKGSFPSSSFGSMAQVRKDHTKNEY